MSGVRISDGSPFFKKKRSRTHDGEVSEWFKELVLKTSDSERDRGFESHPLRQKKKEKPGEVLKRLKRTVC